MTAFNIAGLFYIAGSMCFIIGTVINMVYHP